MRTVRSLALVISLLPGLAVAQVTATYTPFGAGCPGTGSGLGANHVVPAPMANGFGGSDNSMPFTWSPMRYQQVFLGTDLPTAFTMAGLSLRQNENGPIAHGVTVDLEIQVGYTTLAPQTLGTTFAANFDSGPAITVLPRALIVFPDQPAHPTNPAEFFVTIGWPTHFAWSPAAGRNFLIQVTVFGNSAGNIVWGYPLDATWGGTARMYAYSPNATSGTLESNYGLVLGLRALTQAAVPVLYSTSTPQIGDTFRVRVAQARASSAALLCLGVSKNTWAGVPLPLDLGWLGAPGCAVLASIDHAQPMGLDATGYGSFSYTLPNNIYMLGQRFYNQALVADPSANLLGFALSNGGEGLIGNQ